MKRPRDDLEFRRAYDRIADGCIALDRDWRYTHVNARAGEVLGRDPQDLIGKHIWTEFPADIDDTFRVAYEKALAEQRPITVEAYYPPHERWFENRIHASADGLTIYFLDVTERKRAEQMEAGQHVILAGIAAQQRLTESLAQIATLHELLNPGALCSLLLVDADCRHVLHGAAPSLPEAFNQAIHGQEVGDARGSCGTAVWRRERVVVADIATHPYWKNYRHIALAHGLRACWSTPVLGSYEQVLGTFAVYYDETRGPRPEELESIDKMLSITAIAIESDQLIARLRERDYFFDMSMEIYCIFDTKTQRIVQANPTFTELTGYGLNELASRHYLEFVHPDDRAIAVDAVAVLRGAGMRVGEVVYRFRCKDGSYRWLSWESIVGPNDRAFAVAHDVTKRREAEAALAYADTHDAVTHLPHRPVLEDTLASLLGAWRSVWVLVIGLDRFHTVNETMGHVIGDDVLKCVADRLRETVGETGHIARFAGDEFVVAVPDLNETSVMELAQRLREAVVRPIDSEDYRLMLTASIGISHSPDHGQDPQDLLRRAEAAMTRAKWQGRDSVCTFSVQQMRDIEERLLLGHRLRGAVERGEMELHYQPQHRADSGALTGFEALLRWNDPERGRISPVRFIPIAETLGLMPEIGQWVVNEACRQARAWLDRGHRDFTIAVNISVQELQRPGLVAHVGDALRRHALPPEVLDIELTESSLMENVERVSDTLGGLKALGTKLVLDDFGTGYSSLACLKHFPIDKLKIDQSFVHGLPGNADDTAIARTIVAMAHQLRMVVAAEGVENQAQADFLGGIGCDELQGSYFGRAVAAREAEAFFAETAATR
ncbi:MAG TPA: EAL domain-containing protein [Rhodanobacteraceae bacterium]|nr:EAL domain-containing protein [Rhodanobacteraceae bacterium]